jgi:hypothetical protein
LSFGSNDDGTPNSKSAKAAALHEVQAHAVKNTFLEFKAAPEHDFFPEMEDAALLPPRLYGRRARTPDPLRHASIEENMNTSPKPSKEATMQQMPPSREASPPRWVAPKEPVPKARTHTTANPPQPRSPPARNAAMPERGSPNSPPTYKKQMAPKPEVRHGFLHFSTREQSGDFFPETGIEEFLPPRLVGRRARTPDPIRAHAEEDEYPDVDATVAQAMHMANAPLPNFDAYLPEGWDTSLAGMFPFGMPRDLAAQRIAFNQMFPSRVSTFDPESDLPRVPPRVSAVTRPEPFMDDPKSAAAKNDDDAAKATAAKKDKKKVKKKRVDYLGQLPAQQKRELAQEVYDTMIEKGFTRPDGYLLMDVYVEIFRGMIGENSQGRVALHRFSALLRGRSDLFQIFNIGVQVANDSDDWCSRRGEKMVRILLPDADKPADASS